MNLEQFKAVRNADLEKIKQIKAENKPVLIYGCANHAELVCKYLEEYDVFVEGYIVDDQYAKDNTVLGNKPVKSIKNYESTLTEYSIVIGFCDVDKTRFMINNRHLLKGNYYLLWEPLPIYIWDESYISDNWHDFADIYDHLGDTLSKQILEQLILAKLNFDGSQLIHLADGKQYFNELTYSICPEQEIMVDCGAFNGDTIIRFSQFTDGRYKKIYAFEPNSQNMDQMKKNTAHFNNIEYIMKGTWSCDTTLYFEENGSASQITEGIGTVQVPVTSIDSIVKEDSITLIKMDVEGSELESLKGAEHTIRKNMPKLAICCYHKQDDIISIYRYLEQFQTSYKKYKFFLRHHSNSVYETVLYAIPTPAVTDRNERGQY